MASLSETPHTQSSGIIVPAAAPTPMPTAAAKASVSMSRRRGASLAALVLAVTAGSGTALLAPVGQVSNSTVVMAQTRF